MVSTMLFLIFVVCVLVYLKLLDIEKTLNKIKDSNELTLSNIEKEVVDTNIITNEIKANL